MLFILTTLPSVMMRHSGVLELVNSHVQYEDLFFLQKKKQKIGF